tara:strand:+ start:724 stop:2640 length:1917 start_codon:yes stop_codon:yes gene_type:complete
MPVIDFPSNPSNNELFIAQGKAMRYNSAKNKWRHVTTLTQSQITDLENKTVGVSSMSVSGNTLVIQKDDSSYANVSLAPFAGNILTNYASASQLPMTNLVSGTQVYVTDTDSLFITDGSGWYKVATVNLSPSLSLGVSSISLGTGGSVDVNYTVNEPEDTPFTVTASATSNATITVHQANNTITFDAPVAATTETITITASDGVNTIGDTLSMTINLGPTWVGVTQLQDLIMPTVSAGEQPDPGDLFGSAVSFSGDGNFIAIGATGAQGNGNNFYNNGQAYVFKANAGQTAWSISGFQSSGLLPPFDAVHRQIGASNTLSFDGTGTYLAVGAKNTSHNGNNNWGYTWIYKNDGTDYFSRVATLYHNSSGALSQFGAATKMSYDGDMVLISAPFRTIGSHTYVGSVYVYTRSGTTWTNTQTIEQNISDRVNDDNLGHHMDMTKTKTHAIIGSQNISGHIAGKAYIYTISNGILTEQAKLTPSDGVINDAFGASVAINDAGDRAAVGAWDADVGATLRAGAVYIYTRSGTTWSEVQKIIQPVAITRGRFGNNIAMNGDGTKLFISEVGLSPAAGQLHVYNLSGGSYILEETLTTSANAAGNAYGDSLACDHSGELVVAGAIRATVNGHANAGKVTIHKAN